MRLSKLTPVLIAFLGVIGAGVATVALWPRTDRWTEAETSTLRTLWLGSLPPLPADPSNQFADDPRAIALGEALFFDTRFSLNGQVSCGTCHLPEMSFQDGRSLALGVGVTDRRTMPIAGTAYSPWLFWDGRKDSQWAQALGPLESPVEHGGTRAQYAHLIAAQYRAEYEALFGPLPDLSHLPATAGPVADPVASTAWEAMSPADQQTVTQIYVNIGKAITAFERTILPTPTRFDSYVQAVLENDAQTMRTVFTEDEVAGLRLFIGPANCTQCHNGPLLTDNDFHNTAVPTAPNLPEDTGRAAGAAQVLTDGLIGYSLQGSPRGAAADLIRWANRHSGPVLALDAPSGLDAATGTVYDPAIRAAATMTLALPKVGLLTSPAAANVGELYLADISVPPALYDSPALQLAVDPIFAASDIVRIR